MSNFNETYASVVINKNGYMVIIPPSTDFLNHEGCSIDFDKTGSVKTPIATIVLPVNLFRSEEEARKMYNGDKELENLLFPKESPKPPAIAFDVGHGVRISDNNKTIYLNDEACKALKEYLNKH